MPYRTRHVNRRTRSRLEALYAQPPTAFWQWLSGILLTPGQETTESAFAARAGFDRHSLQAWREGALPSAHSCWKIASYLHVPLAQVYALANIPIKATQEIQADDFLYLPDVSADPIHRLVMFINAQDYPEPLKVRLLDAVNRVLLVEGDNHAT